MNLYLFNLILKFFKFSFISLVTLFNKNAVTTLDIRNINTSLNNDSNISATVVNYDTKYVYNSSIPTNETNIVEEGENGIIYENSSIIETKRDKIVEIGTAPIGEFTGKLTGYGPDCVGCSQQGNVSCLTKDKKKYSLKNDGFYYNDEKYGKLRILASSSNFSCGTIIEVSKGDYKFNAIVLDRGYDMNRAYKNGKIWFDLAYDSQASVSSDSKNLGNNFNFKVKRWGW